MALKAVVANSKSKMKRQLRLFMATLSLITLIFFVGIVQEFSRRSWETYKRSTVHGK